VVRRTEEARRATVGSQKAGKSLRMRSQGGFTHFAVAVAVVAGASTLPFLSSFCTGGVLCGIC
jgi:hypothetical protein